MQLTELLEAIETLRDKGWQVKPPAHKSRIISEAMTTMSAPKNRKRSLALKRAWKRRKAAA
jgi:hypothetical protein